MVFFSNKDRQLKDGEIDLTHDDDCAVKIESGLLPLLDLPKKSNQPTGPFFHDGLANNDDFLPMPASKAIKSMFPPGCSVITCCYNGTVASKKSPFSALAVSQILRGTVVHAGINLADDGNRETLYQVHISGLDETTNTAVIRQAHELQFAIGTPVWLWNNDTARHQPAIVVGSEHFPAFTDDHVLSSYVLYSVQVITGNCKVYHGILLDKLVYRSSSAQPPGLAAEKASTTSFTTPATLTTETEPVGSMDSGVQDNKESFTSPNPTKESLLPELTEAVVSTGTSSHYPVDLTSPTSTEGLASPMAPSKSVMAQDPGEMKASSSQQATSYKSTNREPSKIVNKLTTPPPSKTDSCSKSTSQTQLTTPSAEPDSNVPCSQHQKERDAVKPPTGTNSSVVRVVNSDPSPFQAILFGATHHYRKVQQELQSLTDPKNNHPNISQLWAAREVVCHRRCLEWQLNGRCWSDCKRKHDHVRLDPRLSSALEDALRPWIHPAGPIFSRPVTPPDEIEGGVPMNRTRQEADFNSQTEAPPSKRRKFQFVVKPTQQNSRGEKSWANAKMNIPAFFGNDFLIKTIMGKDGSSVKQLCDMFDCTIDIELPKTTSSGTVGTVKFSGSSRQSLSKCQLAIEHVLFRAVPPELREFMLYDLGFFNSYRMKSGKTVLTINPDAGIGNIGSNSATLQHLAVVRSGDFIQDMLVQETDECTFQKEFQAKHPQCRTKLVKQLEAWPRVRPGVAISGSNLEEVQNCRQSVLHWMANSHCLFPSNEQCL